MTDPSPSSCVTKKRAFIHRQAREMAKNVLDVCVEERRNKHLTFNLNNAFDRASRYTGLSKRTLAAIQNESKKGPLCTPSKKNRPCIKNNNLNVDDFVRSVIHRTIEEFYITKKIVPTYIKLLEAIREKIEFPWGVTSLRKLLKEMGYKWLNKRSKRKQLANMSQAEELSESSFHEMKKRQLAAELAQSGPSAEPIDTDQSVLQGASSTCSKGSDVLLSNHQKKKRSQEELELIKQFNEDSTDDDISGDGSSDEEIYNETRTGASKATRANMASSDDSDYEGELYDFGNFVIEQLLSLNVEESRVAQMKIKNLLAEFRKTRTVDSYSEPSISKTQPTQAKKRKIQIQSRPNMTMQSKAKQNKNKGVTEPAELQTHSLSLSDTPLQFEVQQMRNDTAITPAGYVVTPTLTDGVNSVKNEGLTVLLAGFDTSPEVFMAQSEPAQAVSYGTPVDQISVKVEPGTTSTESLLYTDTIVKVEPSETEGSLQAAEKESVVFKIEPKRPEEEEV